VNKDLYIKLYQAASRLNERLNDNGGQ